MCIIVTLFDRFPNRLKFPNYDVNYFESIHVNFLLASDLSSTKANYHKNLPVSLLFAAHKQSDFMIGMYVCVY